MTHNIKTKHHPFRMASVFVLHHLGHTHVFERTSDLTSEEMFYDRCWFIILNIDKKDNEAFADLYLALKYYGATYDEALMRGLSAYKMP